MKKKKELLSHISSYRHEYTWAALFLLFFVMASMHATALGSVIIAFVTILPMLILNELLGHVLIPRFLRENSWVYYLHSFFAIVVLMVLFAVIEGFTYGYLYRNDLMEISDNMKEGIEAGNTSIGYFYLHTKTLVLLIITLAVVTISYLLDERKRIENETKEQQMQMELKYLRAQINPHFLFNALNCIYSLTLTGDEMAPDSVLKLSEMLRFVIDDCSADSVPISKEVAYIKNYIDFQKIRMEHKPNISLNLKVENPSFGIPPMLFQPMIENCFKHSRIVDDPKASIRISLVQKGEGLAFETENTKHKDEFTKDDEERIGIGVQNVRQRLDLLFGEAYSFEIKEDEKTFKIKLII